MFYYPEVLKRHSGCFSIIWLVATKGIKVPRRDFLKVNVPNTCEDIMNFLLERVPPPRPGLPRPRFSLYLSSQLQYGVIVVYHRQCAILLEEIQLIVSQLLKKRRSQKIDLDDGRQAPVLPDALSLLKETEGAPDPLFGVMHLRDTMPSPTALIEMSREYLRKPSPELPELASPAASEAAELDAGITASPESITLRETESVSIPVVEFEGEDLIDHHPETIDFLLAQPDHFPEEALDLPREEVATGEQEAELLRKARDKKIERTKEPTDSITKLEPSSVSSEDAVLLPQEDSGPPAEMPGPPRVLPETGEQEAELLWEAREIKIERTKEPTDSITKLEPSSVSSEDAVLLPQEDSGPPAEMPGPPRDQLTPVSGPRLPSPLPAAREREKHLRSLELEDISPEVKVKKQRRRRQLTFFDPETQLSAEQQQQRIEDPMTETRPLSVPLPSSRRLLPASELLDNPCRFLPREAELLWRRAATIVPIPGLDLQVGERGPESIESEMEAEREKMEEAEREEQRLEPSPTQVEREMVEPQMFDISAPSISSLELSDPREVSREISPVFMFEREGSTVSRSLSTLQDIPEVVDELPQAAEAEYPGLLPELMEREVEPVLFHSILPPEADRRRVSNIFHRLLANLSARRFRVEQDEPYGDILIFPGSNYEELSSDL